MALLNINPSAIGRTIATTVANKAAQAVAQKMSPKIVQDVQRVLQVGNFIGQGLGIKTGIGALDNILSLGTIQDEQTPLLGGLTFRQAQAIHERMMSMRIAVKNLFFIRIYDENPPEGSYAPAPPASPTGLSGLVASGIGAAAGAVNRAVSSFGGAMLGKLAGEAVGSALGGQLGGSPATSIGSIAVSSFDMLALDVSYGTSILGDHTQIGSAFIDKPTGRAPTELQITTMDDEAGTLKRWFDEKIEQVTHTDGTFGLPAEYLVTFEIVHAVPSDEVPNQVRAYRKVMRMRAASAQTDLSRREQAVAELQMTFTQYDNFAG